MKILVIEDDLLLGQAIKNFLEKEKFHIDLINNPKRLPHVSFLKTYDLFLIDWLLGEKEGIDIIRSFKRHGLETPIIMITVKSSLEDKLSGFEAGVDDYITKPFAPEELLARIRAVLKRYYQTQTILEIKGRIIDLEKKEVIFQNKTVEFTAKEFALLEVLLRRRGRVLSYDFLLDYVWGNEGSYETLKAHIYNLRKKLGKDFIKSLKGMGYKID